MVLMHEEQTLQGNFQAYIGLEATGISFMKFSIILNSYYISLHL